MTDDTTNEEVQGGFGELTEREYDESDKPVLVEDKLKSKVEETETETEDKTEVKEEVKETEDKGGEETKEVLTEKGTKLDPNPQSAVHQQLANERREKENMLKLLSDPKLLKEFYEKQYGQTEEVKTETEEVKEFKAEDFSSIEDVAKTMNEIKRDFDERDKAKEKVITELKQTINSLAGDSFQQKVVSTVEKEVSDLSKMDELNPNSENYIEGLEAEIVKEYQRLDIDEQTGLPRGKHSIAEIGKRFVEIAKTARKAGSLKAQTIVKDKSAGRIKTSTKVNDEPNTDDLQPGDSIALGISKMFK